MENCSQFVKNPSELNGSILCIGKGLIEPRISQTHQYPRDIALLSRFWTLQISVIRFFTFPTCVILGETRCPNTPQNTEENKVSCPW